MPRMKSYLEYDPRKRFTIRKAASEKWVVIDMLLARPLLKDFISFDAARAWVAQMLLEAYG